MRTSKHISWMRVARHRHNLTLTDLAAASGIARSTLCKIETGRIVTPHPKTKRAIADALNYNVEVLFHPNGETRDRELREWAKALYGLKAA